MKLGEGGEAFFVFETTDEIPEGLQTSPLVSPATSPQSLSAEHAASSVNLQEPDFLDLGTGEEHERTGSTISGGSGPLVLNEERTGQNYFGVSRISPLT